MELIQLTASYSNAVLMLILSNSTDVATKLDLPIAKPIQVAHVARFVCDQRKGTVGGWLTLTNGYNFWFDHGYVYGMDSSRCYFHLQDPDQIPRFFGNVRMNGGQVVRLARQSVKNLGYNPIWMETETPTIEQAITAPRDKPNVIPHFRVIWDKPGTDGFKNKIDIEINAESGRVEMFTLRGRDFYRREPAINQPPEILPKKVSFAPIGSRLAPLNEVQNQIAMDYLCSKATDFAKRLNLPVKMPVLAEEVKESNNGLLEGDLRGQLILAGGWRFNFQYGHIISFHAPDSEAHVGMSKTWTNVPPLDVRNLEGKVKHTKSQIEGFAAKQVRKLGYPDQLVYLDQPAFVAGGSPKDGPEYLRFYVYWYKAGTEKRSNPDAQFIRAEVDGATLELKSLWINSSNFYQTNAIKL